MASDYIFPCVVVRSMETDLLTHEEILKLTELRTVQDIMNVLALHGYGDGTELENPREFEGILSANLEATYKEVYSVISDESELNFLKYPNDYHNLKVLLKAEFLGTDGSGLLMDSGSIPKEEMAEMVRKREFLGMTVEMRGAVEDAIEQFARSQDPQEIDIRLDRACYKDMYQAAEESGNDFLKGYVRMLIDTLNVNAFVRLKEVGKPAAFFKRVFLEGGDLDESGVEREASNVLTKVGPKGVEKYLEDQRMDYVKDALYVPFGIEPIVGYLRAKEAEVKDLRMILTGKVSGMDGEAIKERLRETYV
ncbi:MAG: V-type ATPase subunit [Firmicutes bacterium]|nr:V-type ATPase subunit [Bacillota bacterium]MBQ2304849.1 V-type ATPase subunit [Bacillota bacterium]